MSDEIAVYKSFLRKYYLGIVGGRIEGDIVGYERIIETTQHPIYFHPERLDGTINILKNSINFSPGES